MKTLILCALILASCGKDTVQQCATVRDTEGGGTFTTDRPMSSCPRANPDIPTIAVDSLPDGRLVCAAAKVVCTDGL